MADAQQQPQSRGSSSHASWVRARKARSQVTLGRRRRRRLGSVRGVARKRLRQRLLQARATGADWREGACEVLPPRRPKAAEPGPTPAPTPAPTPTPAPAPAPAPTPAPAPAPAPAASPAAPAPASPSPAAPAPVLPPIPEPRLVGPGRALLLLPLEQGFTFSGACRVTCLYGQVQVLGFTISRGHSHDLYSPYTDSRLTINAVHYFLPEKTAKEMRKEVRTSLRPYVKLDDRNWVIEKFSPLCSVVLLERLKSTIVNFLDSQGLSFVFDQERSVPQQPHAGYLALKEVGIKKAKRKSGLQLSESALSALEELVSLSCEEVGGCPVILTCGAQDSGKSTFNRYLLNQLLNSLPCVDYLDCDLGQTEFTPPGCISLLNITEPILGPPFTHQRSPQRMVYFGKLTCHDCCESYVEAVKYVFSAYRREAPLIINTMGWVKDKGFSLLIDLIRLLAPTHVLQFSHSQSYQLPSLHASYVDSMDGLYTKSMVKWRDRGYYLPEFADLDFTEDEKTDPAMMATHTLLHVKSDFGSKKNARNRDRYNRILRGLAVLGYLGLLQPPAPQPVRPLQGMVPYQVPFHAVALRVLHADVAPTHILYAVNASWLGLCHLTDDVCGYTHGPVLLAQNPLCDCLGFGVCRGIDMEKRLYLILTPLPPEQLRAVNCLLLGTVSIPSSILKTQSGPEGTIPYVTLDYNSKLPGASGRIGAREVDESVDERQSYRAWVSANSKGCRKTKSRQAQ